MTTEEMLALIRKRNREVLAPELGIVGPDVPESKILEEVARLELKFWRPDLLPIHGIEYWLKQADTPGEAT